MPSSGYYRTEHTKGNYSDAKLDKVLGEFKHGTLRSGSKKGAKVKNRKQAIAIAISEAKDRNQKHLRQ
jgi:hypothetical protein